MTSALLTSELDSTVDESRASDTNPRFASASGEFLAVGGLTLVVFPLAWLLRAVFGLDASEFWVGFTMFHAAHVINDPHFSVTYLLFYKNLRRRLFATSASRAERARYALAGVLVPCALVAWAVFALASGSAQTLGNLAQVLYLLVGWHYAKQGFGVLSVLSARRGTFFRPTERRLILAHCYAAWAFAWANPARAAGEFEEKGVVYWAPAHPHWFELAAAGVLALSTLGLVGCLWAKWRREGGLPFTPLFGFIATIWLWTIYTSVDPLVRYVIPALHSIQYLYFVWLLKRNEARACEGPPLFGPPTSTRLAALALAAVGLGWLLLRAGSDLFDTSLSSALASDPASAALGKTPLLAACYVVVNIHHYCMDSVIWRRDNPQLRYLYDRALEMPSADVHRGVAPTCA